MGPEECTIETSIVNSLYDDGASILTSSKTSTGKDENKDNLKKQHPYSQGLTSDTTHIHTTDDDDDVDFNFSYANHHGVLLNDLSIKLIENEEECKERSFLCLRCSLFFGDDLLALCEHKSHCEATGDVASTAATPSQVKYFLCDLCHSKDPLSTVMCDTAMRAKHNNPPRRTLNSYYLMSVTDKKFYFKCFSDLEALSAHFKAEHQPQTKKTVEERQAVTTSAAFETMQHQSSSTDSWTANLACESANGGASGLEIVSLLESLATNDGFEQYVCCLCNYVCYHLPSLKSHMWTHVKHEKFDYTINTSIM